MRRFLTLYLAVAIPAWAPSALLARQPAPDATIDALEIQGRVNVPEAYIRGVIRTAVGDPVDQAALDADVRRLLATGRFLTASAQVEQRDGQVVAVFWVGERIVVTAVRFRGNVKLKEKKLRELVPVAVGDPVDSFTAREGQDAIVAAYRDEGYGNVVVGFDADLLDQTGELVYDVEEGPRIRIRKIHFEGNAAIDARELNKQIQSKTYRWIFRDGKLDLDQVEQDAVALQSYYRGEGYLDAQASYRVDPDKKPDDVVLVFVVAEGARYRVESVEVEGNTVFSDAELLGSARIREGGIMRQSALDRDERDIQTRYGSQGYIYAGVRAVWVYSEAEDLVQVRIQINEGDAYRVARIVPRGNETTKDKVIRRALNLFPPDDLIDLTELRAAEQRLRETQIFGRATITPVGEQPGVRDLVIDVQESEGAGDFIFGVG
ncbi:MAG: hypothetical protein IID40_03315, partial [Planctomycetes bacterium]|nr:hypothetical protein [Planctomycetota bacterium]